MSNNASSLDLERSPSPMQQSGDQRADVRTVSTDSDTGGAGDDDMKPARVEAFIARWSNAQGSELANYQLFLTELTALLDLPPPDPAGDDNSNNAYVF
jgi:hypothetical protein